MDMGGLRGAGAQKVPDNQSLRVSLPAIGALTHPAPYQRLIYVQRNHQTSAG